MRQRICRRLLAAAASAFALAGSAAAQNETPQPPLAPIQQIAQPNPAISVPIAQPAPGATIPAVPAAASAAPTVPGPGAVVVQGSGGCTNCGTGTKVGTGARGYMMSASGGYFGTNCQSGDNCNSGCGSLRSDAGFALGNCKSFFSPCGPLPLSCNFGKCHTPIFGRGPGGPFTPCIYDSYLNH